jgi:N-hydroxyarylamine O-acetyltransferase
MSNQELRADEALQIYLAKIGFKGAPRIDLATLRELCRRHILAFTYENMDVQLGRRVTRDPRAAFAKLVVEGRGGWCYEYNGLFAWMLETIGFKVRHLAGAVMREAGGDKMIGNHLVPVVELDRLYISDVAMGHFDPVPLAEGPIRQGWRRYSLERLDGGWWRFRNHPGQLPPSFDFSLEIEDPAILEGACQWLQTDPGSPFVRHAIIQRSFPDRMETLTGRRYSILTAAGEGVTEIGDRAAYERIARAHFGLVIPDLEAIWARVSAAPAAGFLTPMDEAA